MVLRGAAFPLAAQECTVEPPQGLACSRICELRGLVKRRWGTLRSSDAAGVPHLSQRRLLLSTRREISRVGCRLGVEALTQPTEAAWKGTLFQGDSSTERMGGSSVGVFLPSPPHTPSRAFFGSTPHAWAATPTLTDVFLNVRLRVSFWCDRACACARMRDCVWGCICVHMCVCAQAWLRIYVRAHGRVGYV